MKTVKHGKSTVDTVPENMRRILGGNIATCTCGFIGQTELNDNFQFDGATAEYTIKCPECSATLFLNPS